MLSSQSLRSLFRAAVAFIKRLPSPESLSADLDAYNARLSAKATANRFNWRFTPLNVCYFATIVTVFSAFASFVVVSFVLGGDACNGKVANGHYLLSDHGHLHEVDKAVFNYSLWHCRSLLFLWPFGMLSGFLLFRDARKRPRR